jgi:hypothetical protein
MLLGSSAGSVYVGTATLAGVLGVDANLHSIIADLGTSGRVLAFCDETDLTFEPTSTMVGDLHLYGGIILRSEAYRPLAHTLTTYLADVGQAEFHGTEIVNPKAGSNWKSLDYGARVEALRHVCTAIAESSVIFVYARICKAQYADMVINAGGAIKEDNYKAAVKQVFLRSVTEHLTGADPAVLLIDREKNTPGPSLVKFEGGGGLTGGGAISADSASVLGLQIADVVAYAIGRFLRRRDKIAAADYARYDRFDTVIVEFLGRLHGRLHDVSQPLLSPLQMA